MKPGHLVQTLNDPKTRLVVVVVAGVLLFLVAGSATIALLIGSQAQGEVWLEDQIPRMLRLVPQPNGPKNTIRFQAGHGDEGRIWPNLTKEIANLYAVYDKNSKRDVTNCDNRVTPPPDPKITCLYDISRIVEKCSKESDYGYSSGSPCIFVQFNHVKDFTPEVFTKQDIESGLLPEKLVKEYKFVGPWVECQPNEVVDVENAGSIEVIPGNELPRSSFPYTGHAEYMAPIIALKLEKPNRAVNIGITCRLWARNVLYNSTTSGLNDTIVDDAYVPSAILPFNIFIE